MVHISKRKEMPFGRALAIRLVAIAVALVVCGIVTTLVTGLNPLSVYGTMISGAFGTQRKVWILLQELSVLLVISLALTPAFCMRFWNLGGEGQVLMGGLASAACMILLGGKLPNALLILLMVVASIAMGALWAVIPAFFKARFNTNETLFTLMMNYVATQIVAYFVIVWEVPKGSGKIGIINQASEAGWLPQVGNKYLLPILVAAVLTVGMYVYLRYTKHGYEIQVVGESTSTARYVGIKVGRVIVRTLLLSGAICGVAGLLLVGGIDHTITTATAGGNGFTAVMVAWLAKFNPIVMIAASFLLVFMDQGAGEIATAFALNQSFGDILTGIILFFIIGSEFFINYQVHFSKKESVAGGAGSSGAVPTIERGPNAEAADGGAPGAGVAAGASAAGGANAGGVGSDAASAGQGAVADAGAHGAGPGGGVSGPGNNVADGPRVGGTAGPSAPDVSASATKKEVE